MRVITGPTAVGKSAYAVSLARENNAEIVSCDSLLVYKHANIGTAKPTPAQMCGVKHHCIDLVEPWENFDVARYIDAAAEAIHSIHSRRKNVIVVGGSGFYLKSFYRPVTDCIKIPKCVEDFVEEEYAASGMEGIVTKLIDANGGSCPSVDIKNPRRVMSALKRCLASGRTHDEIKGEFMALSSPFSDYQKHTILLERDDESLRKLAFERAKKMIADGLIEEVQSLLSSGLRPSDSVLNAIGYRETIGWLADATPEDELLHKIFRSTMGLVKKQKTWFRSQIPIDEKISLR